MIIDQWIHIFVESAPWLVVGFGLAGLAKVFIDTDRWLARALARKGLAGAAIAAVVGAPLPLCSCSVLPAAVALRRQGASRGATTSFLVSVPETDVVSVMLTWALLGPAMAIVRPLAAIATALGTGWAVESLAPEPERVESGPVATGCGAEDCCMEAPDPGERLPVWRRALSYGYVEFLDDISGPLLVGILLAGIVAAGAELLQVEQYLGAPFAGYLVALAVGIPTYVCATASTPVAVGLLAAGMSPGAVLVFLLAGPATNIASFVVLGRELGRRGLVVYIVSIAVASLAFGLAFDIGFGQDLLVVSEATGPAHAGSGLELVAAVLLAALLLASGVRRRWLVGRFLRH
jgi:uncharacterized membrane protein YraQ (UPF0718 family)